MANSDLAESQRMQPSAHLTEKSRAPLRLHLSKLYGHSMRQPTTSIFIAAALLATASISANASNAVFDFENQPILTETPFSMTNDGVTATFSGPADVDPGAFGISSNFPSPTGFVYRLMDGDFLTIGSA